MDPRDPDSQAAIPSPDADPFKDYFVDPDETGLGPHLVHELGHAYDLLLRAHAWTNVPNAGRPLNGCGASGGSKQSEINASIWENWYQRYHAPTLRATYCYPLPPETTMPGNAN